MKTMNLTKNQIKHLNSHSGKLSRRQFVGLGLAGATSVVFSSRALGMPSLNSGLPSHFNNTIPFLSFDLVGGASMPGNFLVGNSGGPQDLLTSYDVLGWNPRVDGWDDRFGLPMGKANVSKIFEGMTQVMSAEAQSRFKMASIVHVTRDDTSDNPLSLLELVTSVEGAGGNGFKNGVGTYSTNSGGNSGSLKTFSTSRPLFISQPNDFGLLSGRSNVIQKLGENSNNSLGTTLRKLSRRQVFNLFGDGEKSRQINNQFEGLSALNTLNFKPTDYSDLVDIYSLNQNNDSTTLLRAGIAHLVINKVSGPGVITIGGCDYHDGTQATGDAKDLEIGNNIGRAIELAHRRKTPLFIHIFTDGGVSAKTGSRDWLADDGEKSLSVIGFYDPASIPTYRTSNSMQIGHFTNGQGVNRDTLLGASPSLASYAVFANYLNLNGRLGDFNEYTARPFTSEGLDSILVFN